MAPSLDVLAIQAEQIRRQIAELSRHARGLRDTIDQRTVVGYCDSIDLLFGQVWATFHAAAIEAATERPECHDHCRKTWEARQAQEVARG